MKDGAIRAPGGSGIFPRGPTEIITEPPVQAQLPLLTVPPDGESLEDRRPLQPLS